MLTEWKKTYEPLVFCNVNMSTFQKTCKSKKKLKEFKLYLNENPEYLETVFDPKLEAMCEKGDSERETEEAKKKKEAQETRTEEAQEPGSEEAQPRRKSPKKYPRGTYSAMPDPQ